MPKIKKRYKVGGILFTLIFLYIFLPIPNFIAYKMALDGSYKGEAVGFLGHTPTQYYRYIMLKTFSSTSQLQSLYLNHSAHPAVKCYAFKALLNRPVNHLDLLQQGVLDQREVSNQFGCIMSSDKVGDLLISEYREQISGTLHPTIDSILLYNDIQLNYKNYHLFHQKLDEKHYDQVVKIVASGTSPTALIALAKYQKLKDTTFINQARHNKNHWDHYFIAIHNFPLDIFENDIITIHEEMLKNKGHYQPTLFALYKAMVSFKSPNIKKQLQKVIDLDSTISFMNEDKKNIYHLLDSLDKQGYVIHKNVFVDDSIQLFDTTYHELVLDSSVISKVEKYISKQQIKESRQITDLKNLLTEIDSYSISEHKNAMHMAIKKCNHDYYKDILPSF